MAKRLTEKNPLTIKYRMLEAFMAENHIQIEWDNYKTTIRDTETEEEALLEDIDYAESTTSLPHFCETNLIKI